MMSKSKIEVPRLLVPNRVNIAEDRKRRELSLDDEEKEIDIENMPLKPSFWFLIVQPLAAMRMTEGGIALPEQHVQSQEYLTTVAEVLAIGPDAFKGKTKAGISLESSKVEVGQWIIYPKHCGHNLRLKTGQRVLILADTDIIAVATDPTQIHVY